MSILPPKMIFVVTEDWYFHSHRLPMARAAQRAGYTVAVVTNVGRHRAAIEAENIRVIPFSFDRRSLNPVRALRQIVQLARLYRQERPHLVHHIAMKPVLFGAIAAWIAQVPRVINAFAGLGFVFTSNRALARVLRMVLIPSFRLVLKRSGSILLLQNRDDAALLRILKIAPEERTRIIRGSGVDITHYRQSPMPDFASGFICAFAGRMIDIKGLPTLRQAAALLRETHPTVKIWLCGQPDPGNPGAWSEQALQDWARESGNVVYRGQCAMADIWPHVHLAVQPSWGGEGIPKSLLEAAASGRPIVASDVPGCREVVEQDVNGLLVPPRDAAALAQAIGALADDPARTAAMAAHSRPIVEASLSADQIGREAEALYRSCLPSN